MRSSVDERAEGSVPTDRILLIDDEPRVLNFVRRGLEAEGMTVDAAGGGDEGLRLALSRSYDLVILDLVMPAIDGHTVLRRILERKPSQAVLILSALNDTTSKVSSLEHGAEDYVSKPFLLDELLARVRARLRSSCKGDHPFGRWFARARSDPQTSRPRLGSGAVVGTRIPPPPRTDARRWAHRIEGAAAVLGLGISLRCKVERG